MTETITWHSVYKTLPDADINVLAYSEETECVHEAFMDMNEWCDVTACALHNVTHWAEMPEGPKQ